MGNKVTPSNIQGFSESRKSVPLCLTPSCQPCWGRVGGRDQHPTLQSHLRSLSLPQKQALATDKPRIAIKENEGCYPLWGVKGCVGGPAPRLPRPKRLPDVARGFCLASHTPNSFSSHPPSLCNGDCLLTRGKGDQGAGGWGFYVAPTPNAPPGWHALCCCRQKGLQSLCSKGVP